MQVFAETHFQSSLLTFTLFSEVIKLIKLYFTLPIITASAERSFSALRQVKTYLRSSMMQERLNNVMLLHCHQNKTESLDMSAIMKDFASSNDARKKVLGVANLFKSCVEVCLIILKVSKWFLKLQSTF